MLTNFFYTIPLIILIILNTRYRLLIGNYFGLIDKPDIKRKFHKYDTPLIGAFPLIVIFILYTLTLEYEYSYFNQIILVSSIFLFIGLVDDKKNISYKSKFFFSTLLLILFLSLNKNFLISHLVFETFNLTIPLLNSHSLIITVICIIILINAFNFTDGINGLSSIIASIWMLLLMLLNKETNYHLIFLSIFIFLNAIPIFNGKYFLGDGGTLLIGAIISLETIMMFNKNFNSVSYEQIFLVFIIPGLDMIRLIFLRITNNKNPFLADRNHLHHLLIKKFSLQKTLLIYSLLVVSPVIINSFLINKTIFLIILSVILYFIIISKITKT